MKKTICRALLCLLLAACLLPLTARTAHADKIYDEIERDCHAYGLLQKRKLAVVARPWQVEFLAPLIAETLGA